MFRALLILLVSSMAFAAPGPKERDKDALYFPTREGTKRVYENRSGSFASVFAEVVTKVEAKNGGFRVTLSREMDQGGTITVVTDVSDKGLFQVGMDGSDLPQPVPQLKLPAKPGDTWSRTRLGQQGEANRTITFTVGKEEEIEVPAGKFKAIPVEAKTELKGRTITSKTWYAPHVGLVKISSSIGDREQVTVLKSFTLGGK